MAYSLDKIAAELGISKASVSLILNGKARQYAISAALEKKVKDFCKSKNYVINAHARRMRQQLARSVGVLIPSGAEVGVPDPFTDYNITEILGGISASAYDRGYQFVVRVYRSESSPDHIFDWVNSREVDGIITYGYLDRSILQEAAARQFPLVAIADDPAIGVPTVAADDYIGSRLVTEHLLSRGHSRLLYLRGMKKSFAAEERYRGFCDATTKAGIRATESRFANFEEKTSFNIVRELVAEGKHRFTAIQCANDMMAVGAIRALLVAGKRVPEDVAVAGADDIGLASYITPALTTFPRHLRKLGAEAFSLLYGVLDKSRPYQTHLLLSTELLVRQSS